MKFQVKKKKCRKLDITVILGSNVTFIHFILQSSIQLDLLEKWLPPPEMGEGIGTEETVTNFKITLDPGSVSEDDPTDDASLSRYHPIDLFFFFLSFCFLH